MTRRSKMDKSKRMPTRRLRSIEDLNVPSVTRAGEHTVKGGPCPGTNTRPVRPGCV